MKTNPVRHSFIAGILAVSVLFLPSGHLHGEAAGDPLKDMDALQQKLQERGAVPQGPAAEKDPRMAQQAEMASRLAQQLKMIQMLIARGDYERARQSMEGLSSSYGFPLELQGDWLRISEAVGKLIDARQAESAVTWQADVDRLAGDARKGCLDAKEAADLDPLLVRCAALQVRRQSQNNVLSERVNLKLAGVAGTLESWAKYLDFRTSGNARAANDILRNLSGNTSQYPVLTIAEISERMVPGGDQKSNVRDTINKVFEGMKSPDDIPAALARIKAYTSNPLNTDAEWLSNDRSRLESFQRAWEAIGKGGNDEALGILDRSGGSSSDSAPYFDALREQMLFRILEAKAGAWTKSKPNPGEGAAAFLARILEELKAKNDYASMLEVMKFSMQVNRSSLPSLATESLALEQYLAGQRFEGANDILSAIISYRVVVGLTGLKYAPLDQATANLKRLQEKNPDAFKDYEGAVLQEIRALRQQVQSLGARTNYAPGGRPF